MTEAVREEILSALSARSPLTHAELLKACKSAEDAKQLSNCLYQLRVSGKIRKSAEGSWHLGERGGNPDHDAPQAPASPESATKRPGPASARPKATMSSKSSTAEHILSQAVENAQSTLDDYLASVADPEVVAPLKAARDLARRSAR